MGKHWKIIVLGAAVNFILNFDVEFDVGFGSEFYFSVITQL